MGTEGVKVNKDVPFKYNIIKL